MTAYTIIEFLNTLPKSGVVHLEGEAFECYVLNTDAEYEAVGDDGLQIRGRAGFGSIATVPSIWLVDADRIYSVRHTKGTDQ